MLSEPHPYPGKLIIVEGIDGSGKTTQLSLLYRWLLSRGYKVFFTEWNSSVLVRRSMRRGKKKDLLTPTTFSLLHAVDFADRLTYKIIPPLKAGMVVLADRFVYTAYARDVARGVHPDWVRAVYSLRRARPGALLPRADRISLDRLLTGRAKLKYHEAGGTGASAAIRGEFPVPEPCARRVRHLVGEFGLRVVDAVDDIHTQQLLVRRMSRQVLRDYHGTVADLAAVGSDVG
jgi:dTMP kinase